MGNVGFFLLAIPYTVLWYDLGGGYVTAEVHTRSRRAVSAAEKEVVKKSQKEGWEGEKFPVALKLLAWCCNDIAAAAYRFAVI